MTRRLRRAGGPIAIAAVASLAASCDDSEIWHAPQIHEERMQIPRYNPAYSPSPVFRDGKAMRAPPAGVVPTDAPEPSWTVDGRYVEQIPIPVTRELVERGRLDFDIDCAVCHGVRGDGGSVVAEKMALRAPPSLLVDWIRAMKPGQLYEIVRDGFGLMPGYAAQLPTPESRWGVVAYVRALQLSQHATVHALPPDVQRELAKEAP